MGNGSSKLQRYPLILYRVCYHIAVVNSAALAVLTDAAGGMLPDGAEKDAEGEPTGVFYECGSWLDQNRPALSSGEIRANILTVMEQMSRWGLTQVHSNDCTGEENRDITLQVLQELAKEDRLSVRIREEVTFTHPERLRAFWETSDTIAQGPFFRLQCAKVIGDGSLGVRTARMREDYTDAPGNRGIATVDKETLFSLVWAAQEKGVQIAVHCIGDETLQNFIEAVEAAQKREPKALRHRVVHCQFGDEGLYRRMKAEGMCADIQPPFVPSDAHIVTERVGNERARESYAWKTLRGLGVPTSGGSDSPVETYDPLWGIYSAVTRTDAQGKPEGGWLPQQKLTVSEAVRLYTKDAAYISFEEQERGTIEPGKLADLVVLSKDIFLLPESELLSAEVTRTVVDGVTRFVK